MDIVLSLLFTIAKLIVEIALLIYIFKFYKKLYNKFVDKRNEKAAQARAKHYEEMEEWEEQQAKQQERWRKANELKRQLKSRTESYNISLFGAKSDLDSFWRKFSHTNRTDTLISTSYSKVRPDINNIEALYQHISSTLSGMPNRRQVILEEAKTLTDEYGLEDPLQNFDFHEDTIKELEQICNKLKSLCDRIDRTRRSTKMIDTINYGKVNLAYWDRVCKTQQSTAFHAIRDCKERCQSRDIDNILGIDLEEALTSIWYFANVTPFSATDFQTAIETFSKIFSEQYSDIIIAELYSKHKLGGEKAIYEDIKHLLEKNEKNISLLSAIASGLMWMKAYESEQRVLQHMLSSGLEMSMPLQQRLHALANGGGKTDNVIEISSEDDFCFDVSPLAWKDNDYSELFDNLAFRGKTLTYSLALRDEDTELNIPSGIAMPKAEDVQHKLESVLADEFDDGVTSKVVDSVAISGGSKEELKGILVTPADCKQMGILIHVAKIGRKLTIKLYTLFLPANTDVGTQKQQALSLYNKLSPSTTRWESSLKEMILVAIQQLLNEKQQSGNSSNNTAEENGPVF